MKLTSHAGAQAKRMVFFIEIALNGRGVRTRITAIHFVASLRE
jgi:hypothetical protein